MENDDFDFEAVYTHPAFPGVMWVAHRFEPVWVGNCPCCQHTEDDTTRVRCGLEGREYWSETFDVADLVKVENG